MDSSVAITLCAHTSLGTQPIYLFGSEEQKREWLPQLCSGEKLGAFGLTEPEAGSHAGNTRTRAVRDNGSWRLARRRSALHDMNTPFESGWIQPGRIATGKKTPPRT